MTEEERRQLKAITTKRKADSQIVKRAFTLLAADESQTVRKMVKKTS